MRLFTPSEIALLHLRSTVIERPRLLLPGVTPLPKPKLNVVPGSQSYTSPGTYYFTIQHCNTLSVEVRGAGGGGGGGMGISNGGLNWYYGTSGNDGSYGRFLINNWVDLVGYGGGGGISTNTYMYYNYGPSGNCYASFADYLRPSSYTTYTGGGNTGGFPGYVTNGPQVYYSYVGGPGGKVIASMNALQMTGLVATVVVGSGGGGGTASPYNDYGDPNTNGYNGNNAAVYVSWS